MENASETPTIDDKKEDVENVVKGKGSQPQTDDRNANVENASETPTIDDKKEDVENVVKGKVLNRKRMMETQNVENLPRIDRKMRRSQKIRYCNGIVDLDCRGMKAFMDENRENEEEKKTTRKQK